MASSADSDEAAHYEPPHLDLHCLQIKLPVVSYFALKALKCRHVELTTCDATNNF